MKKWIREGITFIALGVLLIAGYCHLATVSTAKYEGINTEHQIRQGFRNAIADHYTCYFLGNSRIYRNLNPDMFPSVDAYNFAYDNDCYNQMYYKLVYLLEHDRRPDYLIIGTDYFQFSTLSDYRNYVYSLLFPEEYTADFGDYSWFDVQSRYLTTLWSNKQNSYPFCIKYLLGKEGPAEMKYQKDNGQYVVPGHADGTETVEREYTILDLQYDYFIRIIELCMQEQIDLYVIMPPLWTAETASHTDAERKEFDDMIRSALADTPYSDHYMNYTEDEGLLPYTEFMDASHLTYEASDWYSTYVHDRIFSD